MAVSVSETKRLPQYSPVTSPATAPASCVQSVIYTMEMQSRTRLPGAGDTAGAAVGRGGTVVIALEHLAACSTLQALLGDVLKGVGVVDVLGVVEHVQKQVHALHELAVDRAQIREEDGARVRYLAVQSGQLAAHAAERGVQRAAVLAELGAERRKAREVLPGEVARPLRHAPRARGSRSSPAWRRPPAGRRCRRAAARCPARQGRRRCSGRHRHRAAMRETPPVTLSEADCASSSVRFMRLCSAFSSVCSSSSPPEEKRSVMSGTIWPTMPPTSVCVPAGMTSPSTVRFRDGRTALHAAEKAVLRAALRQAKAGDLVSLSVEVSEEDRDRDGGAVRVNVVREHDGQSLE